MKINYIIKGSEQKYSKLYAEQVYKLCLLGMDDTALAGVFDIPEDVLQQWKQEHKEFAAGIHKGRALADAEVALALYKRAVGYEAPDVDIRLVAGEVKQTPCIKYYPPDTSAINLWLKYRQPDYWADKKRSTTTTLDDLGNISEAEIDARIEALTQSL